MDFSGQGFYSFSRVFRKVALEENMTRHALIALDLWMAAISLSGLALLREIAAGRVGEIVFTEHYTAP